ncbi:hypothetical protein GY45DRAFT_1333113 [Cubamyces sp. BRFM 1775]|nr:hypothetical protein GY45DRAFT_1333113 [Cubamyces sp. BRFM 1775]
MAGRKNKAQDAPSDDASGSAKRQRIVDPDTDDTLSSVESNLSNPANPSNLPAAVAAKQTDSTTGTTVSASSVTLRPSEREYVSEQFIEERLIPILNYVEPDANRYNVGFIPNSSTWGPTADPAGLDRYLCHNGRAVTVWMVGVVTSLWLTPKDVSSCKTSRRFLIIEDTTFAGLSTFASRYLTRKDDERLTFTDVFDATDKLEAWSAMERADNSRVQKTDIVLVECYVKRFKSRNAPTRYTWSTWGVSFELLRIAQLLRGPGPTELVPDDSRVSL